MTSAAALPEQPEPGAARIRPLHAVPDTMAEPPPTDLEPGPDPGPGSAGWEEPAPLTTVRTSLPEFPLAALPDWVAAQVAAVAETFQTPPDLPGCIALAALSAAAGGRAIVRVRAGWDEPVNIYTVVVMPPSSRKSPPFRAMTAPLRDAERELVEATRAEREHARIARATAERAMEKAEHQVASSDDQASALANAVDAALQVAGVEIPPEPRLLADDLTPESAATLLAAHGGRLAVLSAEGGLFATLAGRYSGTPNLDVFLKGYSGDTHRVDRLGRPPEYIDRPAITLGLTVQPAILDELRKTRLMRGTGFLARILYSLPPNTVGQRLSRPPAADPAIAERYGEQLRELAKTLAEWTDPAVLRFTPAADDAMAAYQDAIEPKLDPDGGEWGHIGDWAGKLAGQTARIAGLLHVAHHPASPWNHPVDATTVAAAHQFGDYFTAHALAVFDQLGTDPRVDDARHVLAWIQNSRKDAEAPERFTKRDLFSHVSRGRFKTVTDLDPALAILEEHGHIRALPKPERRRGRPPAPGYLVHPAYWREQPP